MDEHEKVECPLLCYLPEGSGGFEPAVQGVLQDFGFDWLGKVIIHACIKATFSVAFHGVGGYGNNGDMVRKEV